MLMRYHFGLGVGHVYSHHISSKNSSPTAIPEDLSEETSSRELIENEPDPLDEEKEDDGYSDVDDDDKASEHEDEIDEEEIAVMDEMYGPDNSN